MKSTAAGCAQADSTGVPKCSLNTAQRSAARPPAEDDAGVREAAAKEACMRFDFSRRSAPRLPVWAGGHVAWSALGENRTVCRCRWGPVFLLRVPHRLVLQVRPLETSVGCEHSEGRRVDCYGRGGPDEPGEMAQSDRAKASQCAQFRGLCNLRIAVSATIPAPHRRWGEAGESSDDGVAPAGVESRQVHR